MATPTRPNPGILITLALLASGLAPARWSSGILESLKRDGPNANDRDRVERGYYERILDARRAPGAWVAEPAGSRPDFGPLTDPTSDVREFVLKASQDTTHRGVAWRTNDRGMRDRSYATRKPTNTYRIALAGDSIAAGWGVPEALDFESLTESLWNDRSISLGGPIVEIENFAVPGHAPGQRWEHFKRNGFEGDPDLVIFEGTAADVDWDERRLRALLARGTDWESSVYAEPLKRAATPESLSAEDYKRLLKPLSDEIHFAVQQAVVDTCRSRGVECVYLLLPRVGKNSTASDRARLVQAARRAGFVRVIDLSDAFDGVAPESIALGPSDFHPNLAGHAILARALDEALRDFVERRTPAFPSRTSGGVSR